MATYMYVYEDRTADAGTLHTYMWNTTGAVYSSGELKYLQCGYYTTAVPLQYIVNQLWTHNKIVHAAVPVGNLNHNVTYMDL